MKLVEMKCKNCGASLKVDIDSSEIICQYCHTKFKIDDEIQHHKIDNAEQTGYEFEKGKIRAQEEAKQKKISEQNKLLQEQYENQRKKKNLKWWIIGWIFCFPIPLTILIWKSNWEKKKKIIVTIILWLVILIIGYATPDDSIQQNSSTNENEVSTTEENELLNEIFGDDENENNYYFKNEKEIRKFVIAYNKIALTKIDNVEWEKNHKIANVTMNDKSAKLNSSVDEGFLIEFEFTNGKALLEEYKKIISDMVITFDNTITQDTFDNAFDQAKNNEYTAISINDTIKITMHYSESDVGFKSGDRYYIDVTAGDYE